jgi:hypothetical protein
VFPRCDISEVDVRKRQVLLRLRNNGWRFFRAVRLWPRIAWRREITEMISLMSNAKNFAEQRDGHVRLGCLVAERHGV